jgi:antitoxin VapB
VALIIKNPEVEALVAELASLTGESRTEAVRRAVLQRRTSVRLRNANRPKISLRTFLETVAWPSLPSSVLGKKVAKAEREAMLGYDPEVF